MMRHDRDFHFGVLWRDKRSLKLAASSFKGSCGLTIGLNLYDDGGIIAMASHSGLDSALILGNRNSE